MTDDEKQAFVDKANAALDTASRHWWTRYWMVQGNDAAVLALSAFAIGWMAATFLVTGGMK